MRAFNAPYSMLLLKFDNTGMYDTAVEDQEKVFVSSELGGGGTTKAKTVSIAKKGIRNVLIHAGILKAEPDVDASVNFDTPDGDCFVFSNHDGLIEPTVDLGSFVDEVDVLSRVWPLDRTGINPIECRARRQGMLAGRHFPGLVKAGDFMAVIAITDE